MISKRTSAEHGDGLLTFSKPKNLSLPSPRSGPAWTSIFSSGVGSGALGSFFAGVEPVAGLDGALPLRRPKNDMARSAVRWNNGG
jgi:hypothetical protein